MARPVCHGPRPYCATRKVTGHPPPGQIINQNKSWWSNEEYYLHHIAKIMDKEGWKEGATFQRLWFSRKARRKTEQNERDLYVDDKTIKMDWVLGFARAVQVYNALTLAVQLGTIWNTRTFERLVRQAIEQTKIPMRVTLPPNSKTLSQLRGWDLVDWSAAQLNCGGEEPDGLLAALGRFAFYVIPVGTIDGDTVHLEKVGVFVHDSFDFNDDISQTTDAKDIIRCSLKKNWSVVKVKACSQFLGVWDIQGQHLNTKGSNPLVNWWNVGYTFGSGSIEERQKKDMGTEPKSKVTSNIYVGNASYRNYRQKTGRGGDFMIFSDVRVVPIPAGSKGRRLSHSGRPK